MGAKCRGCVEPSLVEQQQHHRTDHPSKDKKEHEQSRVVFICRVCCRSKQSGAAAHVHQPEARQQEQGFQQLLLGGLGLVPALGVETDAEAKIPAEFSVASTQPVQLKQQGLIHPGSDWACAHRFSLLLDFSSLSTQSSSNPHPRKMSSYSNIENIDC